MRSGCSNVSLPCAKPIESPCSSTTVSGSTPCHQKWLGSRLMPTFSPTSACSRRKLSLPKIVTPGCSSRQMRTPGAAYSAHVERSLQNGTTRSRNCHSQSGSSSQQIQETAKTPVEPPSSRPPGQPLMVTTVSTPSSVASSTAPRRASCACLRLAAAGCSGLPAALTQERLEPCSRSSPCSRSRSARSASSVARSRCGRGDHVPTPISRSWMPRSAHQAIASRRSRCASPSSEQADSHASTSPGCVWNVPMDGAIEPRREARCQGAFSADPLARAPVGVDQQRDVGAARLDGRDHRCAPLTGIANARSSLRKASS